jgi:hypothetical protein
MDSTGTAIRTVTVERPLDPVEQLLRRRLVPLTGAIDADVAGDVMARLLYLEG